MAKLDKNHFRKCKCQGNCHFKTLYGLIERKTADFENSNFCHGCLVKGVGLWKYATRAVLVNNFQ